MINYCGIKIYTEKSPTVGFCNDKGAPKITGNRSEEKFKGCAFLKQEDINMFFDSCHVLIMFRVGYL